MRLGAIVFALIVIIAIVVMHVIIPLATQEDVIVKVTKTETITHTHVYSDDDGDVRSSVEEVRYVYTENEVFKCEQVWILLVFYPKTLFSNIGDGKEYRLHVCGFAFEPLDMHRTIISAEET